ncbi:molybdopterin-guanine dinucleotide biosynthesis protein B [Thioalkalivibrio sp.]|uniref:molybdopterin-guanine dinucleotide biosynthesis protein B n=1 Tax=Thioalkalivibrio sp. TaxID=2093813 RepID=UPI00397604D6
MNVSMISPTIPLLGFAAWSGAGKTTLLKRLLPVLRGAGLQLALIKHAHHDFDVDQPGKDSYVLRKAGAGQVLVASSRRLALMVEDPEGQAIEPVLADLVQRLDPARTDLILVEGFKREPIPKIEIHRPGLGKALLCIDDPHIIAVATDRPEAVPPGVRVLPLDDVGAIAAFIGGYFNLPGLSADAGS